MDTETVESADVEFGDISESEIAASWNDTGDTLDEAPQEQADQPEPEATPEIPETKPETSETKPDAPTAYELKHLGETKSVSIDEMKVLAQKGMDYDRVKNNQDERLSFLDELAAEYNIPVKQFIENTRSQLDESKIAAIAEREQCSPETAKKLYEAEKRDKLTTSVLAQKNQAMETEAQAKANRERDIQEFFREYPDYQNGKASLDSLPKEVLDGIASGKTLLSSFQAYENKQLKAQADKLAADLEAERKNKQNAAKSAGSKASAGNKAELDPIAADWYA